MTDVFDVLRKDHTEVKAMLEALEAGPTAASGATSEQLEQRKRLTDQVIIEESAHETAEQQYFWPALRALGRKAISSPSRPSGTRRRPRSSWTSLARPAPTIRSSRTC
jgi:hypothetical protein